MQHLGDPLRDPAEVELELELPSSSALNLSAIAASQHAFRADSARYDFFANRVWGGSRKGVSAIVD